MTKPNYQPWDIDVSAFPRDGKIEGRLKFLLGFAVLAPSGHNSQPWSFSIEADTISIWVNNERALIESDPTRRQLLIGMGCALENLLIAADYYGFKPTVHYFPDSNNRDFIAKVVFEKSNHQKDDSRHLIFSIPRRRTNRNKYQEKLPAHDFLKKIEETAKENLKAFVVTDEIKKQALAELALLSQIEAMDSDSFREELSHYIKSSFTKHKTGMPGFTLGIPAPVSLIASRLIKKVNLSRQTRKKDERLLKEYTPAFVVVSAPSDYDVDRIKAGQLFERIWLMAEQEGLSCAPLAGPVQTGDYYKHVQSIIGTNDRPLVFFRLGYCSKTPGHSPRLSVEEVMNH